MKSMELAAFLSFLCVCSYVLTVIVLMLPALFSRWYTLFFQCMLVVWLCLDNYTLVCDLRHAIDAGGLSHSRADSLKKENVDFRKALRQQMVDTENRLAFAFNEVSTLGNKCRFLEECLRSSVELNNDLIEGLLYWRLLTYKAIAIHFVRYLSASAHFRRGRSVGSMRRVSL